MDLINSQFSIPNSHPRELSKLRFSLRMRIENWELRIDQIRDPFFHSSLA